MRACRRFMRRRPSNASAPRPLESWLVEYVWKVPTSGSSPLDISASQPIIGTIGSWMWATS